MTDDPAEFTEFDEDELVDSLGDAVAPLDTVDPDASFDDLGVVGSAIGDADVIGMGEASHGTREFFRFKDRLFRYLVEERGVRMLGFEANFAAMLDVDGYVLRGEGSAETLLSREIIHGPYRTESMLELIEWIRSFNEGRDPDDRVRVHGIDVQYPPVAASKLESYFETVDPAVLDAVRSDLRHLVENGVPGVSDDAELGAHLDASEAVVAALGDALDEHESAFVDATSRRAYERARRLLWTIEQGRKQFEAIRQGRTDTGANVRIRDSAMAAQVQWLLRHEPPDRIALWGHNAHLARNAFAGGRVRQTQGIPSLGRNLATLQSIDYYALGLSLGGGTVRAAYVPEGEFRKYGIESPPEGSIPDVFGRLETPLFFLDLNGLLPDSPPAEWLDAKPRHFDVAGGYRDTPVTLAESNFRRQFDGLVFVDDTTAARGLSGDS